MKTMEGNKAVNERVEEARDDSRALELVLKTGEILLQSGAEIFRVEETMLRISNYFGVESKEFFVLSNGIFVTGGKHSKEYAKVRHVPVKGTQLDKVVAINQLSREIERGRYTIEEAEEKVEQIEAMKGKSFQSQIFASAIGSGAFCCLFGGNLTDCMVSFLAGFLVQIFVLKVRIPYLSKITGNVCGGALVTLVALVCYQLQIGENLNHMIVGSVVPLIPGVAFINGIREIADEDYIAGAVRLLDAVLGFLCIAIGVGVMLGLFQRMQGGGLL